MATEIKRVRFFDGQFLKEVDFNDEQRYHQHLRRRMNFLLFGSNGVVALGASDLTIEPVPATKTFRVKAGMAIGRNLTESEGREVILLADTPPIDLVAAGIGAGDTASVTIHFEEHGAKDPPSEGDVDEDTRLKEVAVVAVHKNPASIPATTAAGDPFIVLGTIVFDTMTAGVGGRQLAQLRASLLGAAPPPAPSVASIGGVTTVTAGGPAITMTINGSNLAGGTVTFPTDPGVTASVVSSTPGTITVNVTATGSAVAGTKTFVVTTAGGTAPSPAGVFLTVSAAASPPAISAIDVHSAVQGTTVPATITGVTLTGATAVTFSGTGVTAAIQPGGSATSVLVLISVQASAAAVARTFRVSVPGFPDADSAPAGAPAAFAVTAALPPVALLSLQPNLQISGATIDVHGTNIRNAALAAGAVATGTSVTLRSGAVTKAALNATVRPDVAGHQVVRVTIPDRSGTPWGKTEAVTLDLTFTGATGTGSLAFTYDDP